MPYKKLTKKDIISALQRLNELAGAEGIVIELAIYGGALFTILYESRLSTKDVDAIARPAEITRKLAARVASEQDLPDNWLNDDCRVFLSHCGEHRSLDSLNLGKNIRPTAPTAAYLLALKLRACRQPLPGYEGDRADIRFLLEKMRIQSSGEAKAILQRFFPEDALTQGAENFVGDILDELKKRRP